MAALLAGCALAPICLLPSLALSEDAALVFFGVLLGMVPAVYFGFALNDGRIGIVGSETVGALIYGGAAVAAVAASWPILLGIGYLAHALWDAIHPHTLNTKMPWWYVPMCMGFDVIVGLYVLIRLA